MCSRRFLVLFAVMGGMTVFPAEWAIAQDNPFGPFDEGRPGLSERKAAPAADRASADQEAPLAVIHDGAKQEKNRDFCRCIGESDSAAVARIEKVLQSPLASNGFDFSDVPLEEVVNLLQDQYGIPIQVDWPALEATGLDPTEKVTANLHNISLASALRLMLKRLQLTYIIEDEVLLITTPEESEAHIRICVYNVRDFVEDTGDTSMEALIDTIVSCVSTDSWAENRGGEAEIRPLRPGLLVISQTQAVHEDISNLLKAIRDMRGDQAGVARRDDSEVVTRLYALQVQGKTDDLAGQIRKMIVQSVPDAQWEGQLPDGQSVTLTVLSDRIIVRQPTAIQEKVAALLKDSGVAIPTRPTEINRRAGRSGPAVDAPREQQSGGEKTGFLPPIREPRVHSS